MKCRLTHCDVPTGRRTVRMYTSDWRSGLSSSSFCDDSSQCTGNIYDTNAASRCSQNLLLTRLPAALLLILIFFNI